MKPYKSFNWIIVLLVLGLSTPSLTFAITPGQSSGCFLYRESPLYCFDLPATEAQAECEGYEDCALTDIFFPGMSCSGSQLASYCNEILCKSSCERTFAGQCLGGEVPSGQEGQWCSSGCCQFTYFDGNYCQPTTTKWDCQSEALNRDAEEFRFDSSLPSASCDQFCASGGELSAPSESSSFESSPIEIPSYLKPLSEDLLNGRDVTNTTGAAQSTDSFIPTTLFLLAGLGLILGGIWLFYYFRTHTFNFGGIQPLFSQRSQEEKSRLDTALFSPFSSSPEVKARIEALQHRHQLHRKEQAKIEFIQRFDLFQGGHAQNIDALKNVVEARQREAQRSFERLQKLASKPKLK